MSEGRRAAVELAELVQVRADAEIWPCRHASYAAPEVFQAPELQAHESLAELVNSQARDSSADLDKSSAGEMPCRFALRWRCFGARRKLASLTCPEALAWHCLAEAAGFVVGTATCPQGAEQLCR